VLAVRRALKDILAGATFIAFGLVFAIGSLAYEIGSPLEMGPGYVPLALGLLLIGNGGLIVVKGFIAGEGEPIGDVGWRAVILVTTSLLFFGVTVRGLGVVLSLFIATLMAALARTATSVREALIISAALTVLSVLIFIVALQLRLPLIGPWIPF
jgi:hypothetical protein